MRDYDAMRQVIAVIASADGRVFLDNFAGVQPNDAVLPELERLVADGIVDGGIEYDAFGTCTAFRIGGLTDEGRAFWRLVENERVWRLILETLRGAGIDVSYPLLKEVCEEIVRRYVIKHIPGDLG